MTVELESCTPTDLCEGITKEKKEDGHCPGDSKGTCTVDCGGELCKFTCLLCWSDIVRDGIFFTSYLQIHCINVNQIKIKPWNLMKN